MSLTSIQRDFFVKAGLTVLGTSTVTTASGNTSTLQVDGGAAIAKNLIVGQQSEFYGTLNAYGDARLSVTTASVLTVTGRSTLGEVTAGVTTVTNLVASGTANVTGRSTLGDVFAGVTTVTNLVASGTLNVTGRSTLGEINAGATTATTFNATGITRITDGTQSTSPTTGALQVTGGAGIGGNLFVGGTISGTITTASNLAGGATGSIPYQSSAGTTAFIPIGTAGFILQSNGTTSTWVSTGTLTAGIATTASNINGGAQYQIPYQTGVGSTAFEAGFEYNFTTNVFSVDNTLINGITDATSTATGALQVRGGVGINRSVFVGGGINVTGRGTFGEITAGATTVTNLVASGTLNVTGRSTLGEVGAGVTTATSLQVNGPTTSTGVLLVNNSTEATTTATGALQVRGGVGVNRSVWIGQRLNVAGDSVVTGNAFVNGGTFGTSQTTFNLLNTTATTINFGGAGTAITVGASGSGFTTVRNKFTVTDTTQATSTVTGAVRVDGGAGIRGNLFVGGTVSILNTSASTSSVTSNALYIEGGLGIGRSLYVTGPAVFSNDVIFSGTSTYVFSTQTVYTDNILNLHVPAGSTGTDHSWAVDDGSDIGFAFHYYSGTDKDAFLGLANDTKFLEWYDNGTETLGGTTFTGTSYGIFKTGGIRLVHTTASTNTATGALQVVGGVGIGGDMYVGGIIDIINTTEATSSATGALQVVGGAGIGRDIWVGQRLNVGSDAVVTGNAFVNGGTFGTNQVTFNLLNNTATTINFGGAGTAINIGATTGITTVRNNTVVSSITGASSTATGALVVHGGVGINQNLHVGGTITVTGAATFSGGINGSISTATNLAGGATGSIPYQTSAGTTAFIPIGGSGFLLQSNGTTSSWVALTGLTAGQATTASNISGGAQHQIPYQTGAGATAFEAGFEYNAGTNLFSVDNTVINGITDATSTATGSLQVRGGVGINRSVWIGQRLNVGSDAVITGDVSINGGDLITNQATFNLLNTTATTINFGGAGTAITVGAVSGSTTIRNNAVVSITTEATSTATGALQVRGGVGVSRDIWVGQRLNVGSDAVVTGDVTVNGGDLLTNQATFNLLNTTATTINFGGAGTNITIGATTGATTVRNNTTITSITAAGTTATGALQVRGGVGIGGGLVVGGTTTSTTLTVTGRSTLGEVTAGVTTATALTVSGIARFTDATNAVATNDGAVRVTGGVGVVKDVFVGGVITAGATQAATPGSTVSGLFYNNTLLASYTSNAIATVATQNLDSFSGAVYRSAKYWAQVTMGSSIHISEISVMHDGTKAYLSEYGILTNNGQLGTFDATYSGGNVTLIWTAASATSHVIRLSRLTVTV
jgi:hypothetical protein